MTNAFSRGSVKGTANRYNTSGALEGSFDLVILTSSWDERCLTLTQSGVSAEAGVLILFEEEDAKGLRSKHDDQLRDYLETVTHDLHIITGSAVDLDGVWQALAKRVLELRSRRSRPLKIACDLTTCPRFYSLGLLGVVVGFGTASNLTYFYTEGIYPESQDEIEVAFKKGVWATHPVPGFHRMVHPTRKARYILSLGFEGGSTFRVIMRADPDSILAVLPDPGMRPEYVERALRDNKLLIDEFIGSAERLLRARAGDAISAWEVVDQDSQIGGYNDYYLCSGPKPHSLGLALDALARDDGVVLYNLPERHLVVEVEPQSVYWTYEIESLTAVL